MITIEGTAENFQDMLRLISYKVGGGLYSFPKMPAIIEGGNLVFRKLNDLQTIYVDATFKMFNVTNDEGDDVVVLDTVALQDIFGKLFDGKEQINMTINNGEMHIEGNRDSIDLPVPSSKNVAIMKETPFVVKDGKQCYKKGTIEPTTEIKIDANIMKNVIKRQRIVFVEQYDLTFKPNESIPEEGSLEVIVGNPTDKSSRIVKSKFDEVKIIGSEMKVIYGENFRTVFGALDGELVMSGGSHLPLWIVKKTPEYDIGISLTNRRPL